MNTSWVIYIISAIITYTVIEIGIVINMRKSKAKLDFGDFIVLNIIAVIAAAAIAIIPTAIVEIAKEFIEIVAKTPTEIVEKYAKIAGKWIGMAIVIITIKLAIWLRFVKRRK